MTKKKKEKKKKEGTIFVNLPSEDPLVDEPSFFFFFFFFFFFLTSLLREKARKAWPTSIIHNENFKFSET